MINLTNNTTAITCAKTDEIMTFLEKTYGFKVRHTIENCLIYHDFMYVMENEAGLRIEVIADKNTANPVVAQHLAIKDYEKALEEYKEAGFAVVKQEEMPGVKCALVTKGNFVLFVVEHMG